MDKVKQFLTLIEGYVRSGEPIKMTLSRPRPANKEIVNAYLKTIDTKSGRQYTVTYRYKRKDLAQTYTPQEIVANIRQLIEADFFNATVMTEAQEIILMTSKKGSAHLDIKARTQAAPISTTHDHVKARHIDALRPYLIDLGLVSAEGKVYDKAQDKYRQIHKFIEIMDHQLADWPQDQLMTIADMGSGKGYLTFALYDHLTHTRGLRVRMTGYEQRTDLVETCATIAIKHNMVGLQFSQADISQIQIDQIDAVIALHACDIATDMAIAVGVRAGARHLILSPCCHKQVRRDMAVHNELSPILKHGILMERQAELLTDGLRALLLQSRGYKTQVFEFISAEHTGKNLMITATKAEVDPKALDEIDKIKNYYGIKTHYLETLL
jgi:hypothetical protein